MHRQLWSKKNNTRNSFVKSGWLLSSLVAAVLFADPAAAARMQFWRFDPNRNLLEFSTDQAVQPRVQLIPNPTRLVVDLPGIVWGQPKINQPIGTNVRVVRIAQFQSQMTRIVIELDPNHTLDPQQVKVQGSSPTTWSIQLPTPEPLSVAANAPTVVPSPTSDSPSSSGPSVSPPSGAALIYDIQANPNGLFLRSSGAIPTARVKRSGNKREITVEVRNAAVTSKIDKKKFTPKYHGIKRLSIKQERQSPPFSRIILRVDKKSPDWQASVSRSGIVLLPKGGAKAIPKAQQPTTTVSLLSPEDVPQNASRTTASGTQNSQLATISRLYLSQNQLLIQADKPINVTQGWENSVYRLTIDSAQLAAGLREPRLGAGTSLSSLGLRQGNGTVTLLASPAPGVRVTGIQRRDPKTVAVILGSVSSSRRRLPTVGSGIPPVGSGIPSVRAQAQSPLPQVGRRIVVIDPGHGGRDPGAVGIRGLREANVVLDISLEVSRILQRQGVTVYLTRTREVEIDLAPRVALAERARANVFVSIHANAISMSRPDVNGLETYHAPGSSQGALLARTIHNTILRSLNMGNRGVRAARFYVIRRTSMPSVLVETGFVTGAQDAPRLMTASWRQAMAQAIARGILNYLSGRYN